MTGNPVPGTPPSESQTPANLAGEPVPAVVSPSGNNHPPAHVPVDGKASSPTPPAAVPAESTLKTPEKKEKIQHIPSRTVTELKELFKLLSDETRLRILLYLTQQKEMHVRALCDHLGQSQPAVSHHLALLRVAKLIEPRREGKHNFYRIRPERFQELLGLVFSAMTDSEGQIRFEDYTLNYDPKEQVL